jgi:tRNA A-37 threonylcarbamoyl transferase component Bud32
MGVVYLAEDAQLRRRVAMKVITPDIAAEPSFRERFLTEARIAASVEHPNVVPVYDVGEHDSVLFLACRYVDGLDLREVLLRDGRLDLDRTVRILREAADALDAVHARDLLHRDVKPGNILIESSDRGEHALLTDFGLARQLDTHSISGRHDLEGTLSYVAPEQIRGDPLGRTADVYSLGCVTFECLAGSPPFSGSAAAVMHAHLIEPPPSLMGIRPELPRALDSVVATALAKSPQVRYASAGALATAVEAAIAGDNTSRSRRGGTIVRPQPRPQERKLVTVLTVDLALPLQPELDIEDAEAILAERRALVAGVAERFGGLAITGPDGVRVVFGIPDAREDDAERAVRCALALRATVLESQHDSYAVALRVGVATGEAVVGFDDVTGPRLSSADLLALATRLQALAAPNEVMVSDATFEVTTAAIEYSRSASGVVAVGARSSSGVEVGHPATTPFVGRDDELTLLWSSFDRARRAGEPQFLTVIGVPGIGKSRLVREFSRRVDDDPNLVKWRQARTLPHGEGGTFWPLAEIIKADAGILESDGTDIAERKLVHAVADVVSEVDQRDWVTDHLRALVGIHADHMLGDRQAEAFMAWTTFLEGLAARRPAVVVFEDLHWADDLMLDFVSGLTDGPSAVPLLVLCTARPELLERRQGWGGGARNTATLALDSLSAADTARVFDALVPRDVLSDEIRSALAERVEGNPLYAEEYARLVVDRGASNTKVGTVPDTIHGLIGARIDALALSERAVVRAASVIGKVFWSGAVCQISGIQPQEANEALQRLLRKEFIRRERRSTVAGEVEYSFRHILLRDVAYGQMMRADRVAAHEAAAKWLANLAGDRDDKTELLAYHYGAALSSARARGMDAEDLELQTRYALRRAGERALELNAFASAERFYSSALDLWPLEATDRPMLLFGLGKARYYLDDSITLLADLAPALAESGGPELASEADTIVALHVANRGEVPDGMARLSDACSRLESRPPSRARVWASTSLASGLILAGDHAEIADGIRIADAAAAEASALSLRELEAEALMFTATGRLFLDDPGAAAALEKSVALAAVRTSIPGVLCLVNASSNFHHLGQIARGENLLAEAETQVRQLRSSYFARHLKADHAHYLYYSGQWELCEEGIDQLLAEIDDGEPLAAESTVRRLKGRIRMSRGDSDGLVAEARDARSVFSEDQLPAQAFYLRALVAAGDLVTAEREARDALDTARNVGAVRAATGCADIAYSVPRLGLTGSFLAVLHAFRVESAWVRAAEALASEQFETAADIYAEIGSKPDWALAEVSAARQQIRSGAEPAAARRRLDLAIQFWDAVGASAYAGESRFLRRVAGAIG